jgi:hypothetical protein
MIYTFPNINIDEWFDDRTILEINTSPLKILDHPFGKSLIKYYKELVTAKTKYYDPTNGGFIIIRYNPIFMGIMMNDVNSKSTYYSLFGKLLIINNMRKVADQYHKTLIKQMIKKQFDLQDIDLKINTYTRHYNAFENWLNNYLLSDQELETDPNIDILFSNPIRKIQYS